MAEGLGIYRGVAPIFTGHDDFERRFHRLDGLWEAAQRAEGAAGSSSGEPIHSLSFQASFAEQAIVPERCAVRVRRDAPLDKLAGLACGISTGLGAALVRSPVEPGSNVVVIGAGGVGLSALMGARVRGAARSIAVDVVSRKLAKARELGLADEAAD